MATDAPKERKILGITIGDIIKPLLGGLVGLAVGYALALINSKSPHLTVIVPELIAFKGDKTQSAIINYSVASDGSLPAENVECEFTLKGGKIQEVKAAPENVHATIDTVGDRVRVTVPMLNAGERFSVSALVSDATELPDKIAVSVRGKGVIGENAPPRTRSPLEYVFTFLFLVTVCIAALVSSLVSKARANIAQSEKILEDAKQVRALIEKYEGL